MPKYERFVDIKKSPKDINNWRLVSSELGKRARSLHRTVSYLAAQDALNMVQEGIPGGSEYRDLKKSLQVSEVGVGSKDRAAYAIHVPVRSKRVRKIDVPKTVLYVRAKKRLVRPDLTIKLLEDKGPWTADTIPFWPSKREATVIQRKVTKKEADRVAKMQAPKIDSIRSELRNLGRKIKKKKPGDPGNIKRGGKAVPDVAMQALDMEFGSGGKRSTPVFRKMIGAMTSGMGKMPNRHKIIKDTMLDPNSQRYKNFPPKTKKMASSEANKFIGFQKRLGR